MSNTSIVVCGKKYDIGTRVVLWDEPSGFNAYDTSKYTYKVDDRKTGKTKTVTVSGVRYSSRSWRKTPTLEQLKGLISQFFLHHSGLYRSKDTFHVLHKQRRLSVHFILDDNGILYQTLDVLEKAWHGGKNNPMSIGIEIDSRAHVSRFPTAYDAAHQKKYNVGPRRKRIDLVGGRWVQGYEYSDAQYETLIRLGVHLKAIFPNMKTDNGKFDMDFPRLNSRIITSILSDAKKHKGLICHYNNSSTKNDPIAFDHYRLLRGIQNNSPKHGSTFLHANTWLNRQEWLAAAGYNPGDIDGDFGTDTKNALKRLQAQQGIGVDGVWGGKSEYMLDLITKEKGLR